MKPTITEWIKDSVEKRKKAKHELDSVIALSNKKSSEIDSFNAYMPFNETTTRIRMIDEGAVMNDDDSVRLFITKGTIQKFYDSLDDDYVGYVNLGHIDLESLPLLLGTWTKKDLHIVEKEDGRMGLDADLHINEDLSIVKDLRKSDLPLSMSVEMFHEEDYELSELLQMPVTTEIFIFGVSVVGNPANVTSANVNFGTKGEDDMGIKDLLNTISLKEELQNETEVEETEVENLENEETEETDVENLENKEETEVETLENQSDETEVEETVSDADVDKVSDYIEKLTSKVEELQKENKDLKERLEKAEMQKSELSANIEKSIGKIESLMEDAKSEKENLKAEPAKDGWFFRG